MQKNGALQSSLNRNWATEIIALWKSAFSRRYIEISISRYLVPDISIHIEIELWSHIGNTTWLMTISIAASSMNVIMITYLTFHMIIYSWPLFCCVVAYVFFYRCVLVSTGILLSFDSPSNKNSSPSGNSSSFVTYSVDPRVETKFSK